MSNSTRFTNSPRILCWRLTYKCNRACDFCLSRSSPSKKLKPIPFEIIINRIKELGFNKISYSGGEPFLVPNFEEIVNHANKNDIIQIVTTNGDYLFNHPPLELLEKFQYIKLSFYGGENYHNKIMGIGHFQKLISLIKHLRQNSLEVGINYMLSKQSIYELEEFLEILKDFGLFNFLLQRYIPTENFQIDSQYVIKDGSTFDLSTLKNYTLYFKQGIKYFNYQIGQGFQIVLDENLDLYFPNSFGQIEFKYGNIFNETQISAKGDLLNLRSLIEDAISNRINSNTIQVF